MRVLRHNHTEVWDVTMIKLNSDRLNNDVYEPEDNIHAARSLSHLSVS